MTKEQKLLILENRYAILSEKPINDKSTGVKRKLARQIRNLKK